MVLRLGVTGSARLLGTVAHFGRLREERIRASSVRSKWPPADRPGCIMMRRGLFAATYEMSMPSRSNDAQRVIVGVASKSNVVLRVIVAGVSKADVDFGAGGMKRVDVGRQPSGGVFEPVCAAES